MRKVIVFNMLTLDGYFSGPDGDIDWHQADDEFNAFSEAQLATAGGLLFGRVTYQLMAAYWPTPGAIRDDPEVARMMNNLPKVVFSRTLPAAGWNNTRLISGPPAEEVRALKQQPGRNLFIFGSAGLSAALAREGLIDEYRLIYNPVVLGSGRPFFEDSSGPMKLRLLETRAFGNGNVLLVYQPQAA